jgi:hypothetical protein
MGKVLNRTKYYGAKGSIKNLKGLNVKVHTPNFTKRTNKISRLACFFLSVLLNSVYVSQSLNLKSFNFKLIYAQHQIGRKGYETVY